MEKVQGWQAFNMNGLYASPSSIDILFSQCKYMDKFLFIKKRQEGGMDGKGGKRRHTLSQKLGHTFGLAHGCILSVVGGPCCTSRSYCAGGQLKNKLKVRQDILGA